MLSNQKQGLSLPIKPLSVSFVLPGAPRTKKTSNRLIQQRGRTLIVPSKPHMVWFGNAMSYVFYLRPHIEEQGVKLPICNNVRIDATFYLERDQGDLNGYQQALGDWLQSPKFHPITNKQLRDGSGIIADDRQIKNWGDTHTEVDPLNPRIEVRITVLCSENSV